VRFVNSAGGTRVSVDAIPGCGKGGRTKIQGVVYVEEALLVNNVGHMCVY
jgi:hypothetical protein